MRVFKFFYKIFFSINSKSLSIILLCFLVSYSYASAMWSSMQSLGAISEYYPFMSFFKTSSGNITSFVGTLSGEIKTYDLEERSFVLKETMGIESGFIITPALSDMNGDGKIDVIAGNSEGIIKIFFAISHNKFMDSGISISSVKGAMPSVADFDNDGDYDIIAGNILGTIAYYRNDGDRKKPKFVVVKNGKSINGSINGIMLEGFSQPRLVDMDRDGDFDIIALDYNGKLTYFQNNGTPEKYDLHKIPFDSGSYENISIPVNSRFDIFDITKDGLMDIVFTDSLGSIYIIYGQAAPMAYLVKEESSKPRESITGEDVSIDPLYVKAQSEINNYITKELSSFQDKMKTFKGDDIQRLVQYLRFSLISATPEFRKDYFELMDRIYRIKETGEGNQDDAIGEASVLPDEALAELKSGLDNIKKLNYKDAINNFKKLSSISPNFNSISYIITELKKANIQLDKNKKSIPIFSEGMIELKKGNYKQAAQSFALILKDNPHFFQAEIVHNLLTENLEKYQKDRDFVLRYKAAEKLYSNNKLGPALNSFSNLYRDYPEHTEIKDKISAIQKELSMKLSEDRERKIKFYIDNAERYMKDKIYDKALQNYKLVKKLDPNYQEIDAKIAAASLQYKKSRFTLTPQQEKMIASLKSRAYQYFSQSNYTESYKTFKRILEIDPYNETALKSIRKLKKILQ